MALKKSDTEAVKPPADLEADRVAAAVALEEQNKLDAAAQKKLDDEAAQAEADRLQAIQDGKDADTAEQNRQAAEVEQRRLAAVQEEADKDATSDNERLAQEAEVARLAGKEPLEQTLVLVQSNTYSDLRQPSTGKWISGHGQAHLLNDGWLDNQIRVKLLKIVKPVKED